MHKLLPKTLVVFALSLLILFSIQAKAQYCVDSLFGGGCASGQLINSVVIAGTGFNSSVPLCTNGSSSNLTVFPPSGSTTTTLIQGQTYNLSVTTDADNIISVWIDYDHNFIYDAVEWTQVCTTSIASNANTISITIPFGSYTGLSGMRIRSRQTAITNGAIDACTPFYSGETEDYTINIGGGTPCTAPPVAGISVSSVSTTCQGINFGLSLFGNSIGTGLTYQWQRSQNNSSWNNIAGATNTAYLTTISVPLYFRCIVTCSGSSDASTSVHVGITSGTQCYCSSGASNTVDDDIGNVTFGALNNGTGAPATANVASTNLYTDFTSLAPQSYIQTYTYPISITQINSAGFYACWASVFIDYNQDGDFYDAGERVFDAGTNANASGNIVSGNVTIPLNASLGNTRMRVVLAEAGSAAQTSCASYTWGETEDYSIIVIPITPCTVPPTAGVTVSSIPSACPHVEFNLSLSGGSIGLGLTYQWESSLDGLNWNAISGADSAICFASQLVSTYYRCIVTCSGVSVNSTSLPVPMEIGSATFSSTAGGLIPDNNTTVCFPIAVSGISSQMNTSFGITEVCINIQHLEVGELKVFLKSPTGDTVYLSENNGGLFANYTNTCFAMNGTNGYIYTGNAPFTGTFIPNYSLNDFNNGQNPNGTWYLCIKDEAPSVTPPGQFLSASVSFCSNPPADPVIPVGSCSGTNAFACQCPDGTQNCDLLPDMTASALIILNDHPETLGSLRLSNATPNIGWGPMEIHGSNQCYCDTVSVSCTTTICPNGDPVKELVKQTIYHKNHGIMTTYTRDAGYMSYHAGHGHVHVDSWGAFSLRIPTSNPDATTWPIVGTGAKVSFCLINLGNCTNNTGYCVNNSGTIITQADIPNSGFGSVTGCGKDQGIFTGSLDIYSSGLQGMQIDFPGTCNGNYAIVSTTDPNNNFLEQDETNNWVQVPVTLTQQFPPSGVTSFAYSAAGNTLSFTNTTPLTSGYLWDFGDGSSDTTANPIHTYAFGGMHSVKLIALNQCYTATVQNILITGIKESENFALGFSANPNPSNGDITISYFLPQKNKVSVDLFNLLGEKITAIYSGNEDTGKHQLHYDFKAQGLASGTYLLKISIAEKSQTIRLVLLN